MAAELQVDYTTGTTVRCGYATRLLRLSTVRKWFKEHVELRIVCGCGCGGLVKISPRHYYEGIPKLIKGHKNGWKIEGSEEDRFWALVDKSGNCWKWIGRADASGYGLFREERRRVVAAHRFVYKRFVGKIGLGLFICHACDNPCCVRPSHLFLGTQKENMVDAKRKGRLSVGPTHGRLVSSGMRRKSRGV